MPRAYAPELRRRVIDLIEGGRSVAEVAAIVEPTEQTIYNWWNRHLVDTGRRAGTPTIENQRTPNGTQSHSGAGEGVGGDSSCERVVEGGGSPKSNFEAISVMASEGHAVERACRITGVSHAGYYMWLPRAPSSAHTPVQCLSQSERQRAAIQAGRAEFIRFESHLRRG